jgi:hypothetical protein
MNFAPVVLFVYNRLEHTKKCIFYLKKNKLAKKTSLIIYSDTNNNKIDKDKVQNVRIFLQNIRGFKKVKIIKREKNFGLYKNIVLGVSEVIKKYGKAIILEDDLIVHKNFLDYMNDGLNYYSNHKKVASIHGYVYPVAGKLKETFFLYGGDCWGWATWKDRWLNFNKNPKKLLKLLKKNKKEDTFNYGVFPKIFSTLLKERISKKNKSWAILWHAYNVIENKLTLYPRKQFVKNIGFDGTGTHSGSVKNNKFNSNDSLIFKYKKLKKIDIKDSLEARNLFRKWLSRNHNFYSWIYSFVKGVLY